MGDDGASSRWGLLAAAVAVGSWGGAGVFVKSIEMEPLAMAAYRYAIFVVFLGVVLWRSGARLSLSVIRRTTLGGLFLAGDVGFFFSAVKLTSIVNATIIGALMPIAVMFIAWRFFGERVRRADVVATVIAFGGVIVVVATGAASQKTDRLGDVFAVLSLLCWSGYFVTAKQSRGTLTSGEYTMGTSWWVFACTAIWAVAAGQDMSPPGATEWWQLLALALTAGLLGHLMMNWALVRVPLWLGSTMTLMIPVVASVMAWTFLDERITAAQVGAGLVVVGALSWMVYKQRDAGDPADVATAGASFQPSPATD